MKHSKKQQVTEYLSSNPNLTRSQAIPKLMELFNMTKAGASTYFYNYHNQISDKKQENVVVNIKPKLATVTSRRPSHMMLSNVLDNVKVEKDRQGKYTKIMEK